MPTNAPLVWKASTSTRRVLVVHEASQDYERIRRSIEPVFEGCRLRNVTEARDLLRNSNGLVGAVIQSTNDDGASTLDLVTELQRISPALRILVLGLADRSLSNRAYLDGVGYAVEPASREIFQEFARTLVCEAYLVGDLLRACLRQFARRKVLTPRQTQIIALGVIDLSHREMLHEMRIKKDSLKKEIRGLLKKCGACGEPSVAEIARTVRAAARSDLMV